MLSRMADTAKTKPAPANKAATKSAHKSIKTRPEVRFRMRIRSGDAVALGPGKVDLLEAVREFGSISAAARSLGMSYRRAWLLIDELNRSLKAPATQSEQGGQSGGGCTLTEVGETIVRLYRDVEEEAQRSCAKQIAELTRLIR
jgi:molybdate transport system regulatory protein